MKKKTAWIWTIVITLLFAAYVTLSFLEVIIVADLFSSAAQFLSAGVLLWLSGKVKAYGRSWLMFGLACLSYGLSDLLWVFWEHFLLLNPDESVMFSYLYLLPNLFILGGVYSFFHRHRYKWNFLQLMVDILAILILSMYAFWMMFFKDWPISEFFEDPITFSLFLYILTDFAAVVLVAVMALFHNLRRATLPTLLSLVAVDIYAAADLAYAIQINRDAYIPNNVVDNLFILALCLFGVAGLQRARRMGDEQLHTPDSVLDHSYKRAGWKIMWALFGIPLFYALGFRDVGFYLSVIAVVLLYQLVSGFVYNAARNEELLRREKGMTADLEEQVIARMEELQAAYEELDVIAKQDSLTGLTNRRRFLEELDALIEREPGKKLALFYMDLDRFKAINDSHGHDMGDIILTELATRMNSWLKNNMSLARISGDEFVLLSWNWDTGEDLERDAQELIRLVELPVQAMMYRFQVSASIGISIYPTDAQDRATLLQNADMAMYHAKEQRTTHISFYSAWFSDSVRRKNEIEIKLKNVIPDQEFQVFYQPQFSADTEMLVGMEALIRWRTPDGEWISPVEFIPIAEETGQIVLIGEWVLQQAIRQISIWNHRYGTSLRMGINISPKQFHSVRLFPHIRKLMQEYRVSPSWLDMEITESSAMNTETSAEEFLVELSGMGISISIDDFGTGYSSLNYIKRFDIDALKIAKPLVDNISEDMNSEKIVQAIIAMASALSLRTIAEGVETREQLNLLNRLGCREIQGYLLGKPVSSQEFERLFLQMFGLRVVES